jgi:hypothetical protein
LNKLGDGSLSSANQVDKANLDFAVKLLRSISPLPVFGPNTRLLVSSTATNNFLDRAKKLFQGGTVHSLRDGLPNDVKSREVFVLVAPSVTRDYDAAKRLVATGNTVVLINGFAKVRDDSRLLCVAFSGLCVDIHLFGTIHCILVSYLIHSFACFVTLVHTIGSKEYSSGSHHGLLPQAPHVQLSTFWLPDTVLPWPVDVSRRHDKRGAWGL